MIDIYDPEEFVDDWYCKDCEHGPIGIEKDACPVCGSTWLSQNDGAVDSDDMESLDELRDKEYGNEGVEGIYNWDEWN